MEQDKVVDALEQEIFELESRLARLRNAKAILVEGISPVGSSIRRRLKFTRFTPVETAQLINLWNDLVHKRNIDRSTALSKIASVMKQPRDRIQNKIFHLSDIGKLRLNGVVKLPVKRSRAPFMTWTPELTKRLVELHGQNLTNATIADMMKLKRRQVDNKLNKMRIAGKL